MRAKPIQLAEFEETPPIVLPVSLGERKKRDARKLTPDKIPSIFTFNFASLFSINIYVVLPI